MSTSKCGGRRKTKHRLLGGKPPAGSSALRAPPAPSALPARHTRASALPQGLRPSAFGLHPKRTSLAASGELDRFALPKGKPFGFIHASPLALYRNPSNHESPNDLTPRGGAPCPALPADRQRIAIPHLSMKCVEQLHFDNTGGH